jgi:hypothetical protein
LGNNALPRPGDRFKQATLFISVEQGTVKTEQTSQ